MKTHIALATAIATTLAAPAFAQDRTDIAVANFNQSTDTAVERIAGTTLGTTVSSMGADSLQTAISVYNGSVDSVADRVNSDTVTVFSGEPSTATAIFERLRREDDSR